MQSLTKEEITIGQQNLYKKWQQDYVVYHEVSNKYKNSDECVYKTI